MSVALQTTNGGVFSGTGNNVAGAGGVNLANITQDADCNRVFICVQHEGNDVAGSGQTTTDMTCTFGGVAATLRGTFKVSETVQVRTTLFEVLAANLPAAGASKTVTLTYSGTAVSLSIAVVLLTGASQAAVDGQNISGTNTDGDVSQNVNVAEADSAVLFFCVSNGPGDVSGNRTQLFKHININSTTSFYGQIQLGAGTGNQSQTVDFVTNPARTTWAGVAVRSAAAAASLNLGPVSMQAGAATISGSASRGRSLSASMQAGSASMSSVVSRGRSLSSSLVCGSATVAAVMSRGRSLSAGMVASPAAILVQVSREREISSASMQAGPAIVTAQIGEVQIQRSVCLPRTSRNSRGERRR